MLAHMCVAGMSAIPYDRGPQIQWLRDLPMSQLFNANGVSEHALAGNSKRAMLGGNNRAHGHDHYSITTPHSKPEAHPDGA